MNATNTQHGSTAKRVDVIATPEMENRLRSLNVPVDFRFATQVSMETQQMDEVERKETASQQLDDIQKMLKAAKPTGTPHLFLLDPEALAVGSSHAQSVLQALASTRFSDSDSVVAAMLPPDSGYTIAGQAAATLVKQTYLKDAEIPTFESVDALTDYFKSIFPEG